MTSIPPRPRQTSRYYAPGEVIAGKYELVRPLGEGGMGSVWLATNRALDSSVALKLLRADLDADDAGERLMQEARAAARIGHRAIVRVFDFGHTEQGDPFIVMELLEGESLADVLTNRGRLSPTKAVQTLLPVVDALAAAHARGIVHRDLKPDNIFLVREQRRTQPKVVDFGIAKVEQRVGVARTLTRQGTVLGSPGYMSPEQARGLAGVDQRTDVWSLCVVLYECITAQPAFAGDNYNALMRAIIEDPVLPSTDLVAGDAALWAILERGLRKDPAERWASMRELGAELARWLLSHDVEQDVCGEPVSGFLDAASAPSSGPRDILSVPPPSMLGGRKTNTPGALVTVNQPASEEVPRLSPVPVGRLGSYRPGPESTSAVIRTGRPPRLGSAKALIGAAVAVTGLGLMTFFVLGRSGSPDPAASVANQAPAVGPRAVETAAPPAIVVAPVPPPVAAADLAPPSAVAIPSPKKQTSSIPKSPAVAKVPATSARAKASLAPASPSPQPSLKDPY